MVQNSTISCLIKTIKKNNKTSLSVHASEGSVRNTSLHAFVSFFGSNSCFPWRVPGAVEMAAGCWTHWNLRLNACIQKVASALHMASRWPRPVIWLLDLHETAAVLCGLLQKMASTYSLVLSSYPHINSEETTGLPSGYSLGSGGRETGQNVNGCFLSFFCFNDGDVLRYYVCVIGVAYDLMRF